MVTKKEVKRKKRAEKQERIMASFGLEHRRNDALFDPWSIAHVLWAMVLAWLMNPAVALALMVLWEPLEVLILSPFFARRGISFGYESIRNSLSDIFFDVIGIILGVYILSNIAEPPFYLFENLFNR